MQAAREDPVRSKSLALVRNVAGCLRINWSETDPIAELARPWTFTEPQLQAYVNARARCYSSSEPFRRRAEDAEKQPRSIVYQMGSAKLLLAKEFADSLVLRRKPKSGTESPTPNLKEARFATLARMLAPTSGCRSRPSTGSLTD
jgi:hypothetical protein